MKNTIIGIICFLMAAGALLRSTDGSAGETEQPKEEIQQSGVVEPEKEYKLIEETKVYLATSKETFMYYCSPCHGVHGNGKGIYFTIDLEPRPRDLTDIEYMAALTDDYLLNFISKGSAAMEKSKLCPPWGKTLGEDRIKGLIVYLRGLTISKSKEGEETVVKAEAAKDTVVKKKGTPPAVIWSVLLLLTSFLVFAARKEWKKLAEE